MIADLISLALIDIVFIAGTGELLAAQKSFISSRSPNTATRGPTSRPLLSALPYRSPPSILSMPRRNARRIDQARNPAWPKHLVKFALSQSAIPGSLPVLSSVSCDTVMQPAAARNLAASAIPDRGLGEAMQPPERRRCWASNWFSGSSA